MITNYSTINSCRLCKHDDLYLVLDFGKVSLANSYPSTQDEIENQYPLTVSKCAKCGHVQLNETINPEILFTEYAYASSDSPSLIKHFAEFANTTTSLLEIEKTDSILEIGSNDGILLKEFANLGYSNIYGVEPASNIANRSTNIGAKIYTEFFNTELANRIVNEHGKIKLICANNVFAHIADIDSVTRGIIELISDNGVFVFENAYLLDTIKGLYFDQVYHEHLQYYGILPLTKYLSSHGLEIFRIQKVNTQGGSFRIYTQKQHGPRQIDSSVQMFLDQENNFKLYNNATFEDFNNNIQSLVSEIRQFVDSAKVEGKTISCYGCPAKFALFSKVFGLDSSNIKYVVDDSPLKQNKYSPGSKIPIVNRDYFYTNPTDYCIISVWNMAEAIIQKNKSYTGQFVIPMPQFIVQPKFLPYY